jgi:hypothetical protein
MEEITGIFSSPRKPSPLKNMTVMESVEEAGMSQSQARMFGSRNTPLSTLYALSRA